jgi:hypothetical protein
MNGFLWAAGGLVAVLGAVGIVAWLKGTLGFVREISRSSWEQRGEPWVQYALLEPILFLPFAFVAAAFQLAHPDSRWARRLYSDERRSRARERYATAAIAPLSPTAGDLLGK